MASGALLENRVKRVTRSASRVANLALRRKQILFNNIASVPLDFLSHRHEVRKAH